MALKTTAKTHFRLFAKIGNSRILFMKTLLFYFGNVKNVPGEYDIIVKSSERN